MFSLAKLAYCVYKDQEKPFYNDLETINIDVPPCCNDIIRYQKNKTKFNIVHVDIDVKFIDDEGKQ